MVGLTRMVNILWLILQAATVVSASEGELKPDSGPSSGSSENSPGTGTAVENPPNLVFVLVDDVGWADFSYNVEKGAIPTPGLDKLAARGIQLKSHYVQPTCTPSRAALMTGRYAANTGLPFAMFPGSVAGLPQEMPTMPQLLRKAGYSAHMVGKWHLGHSKHSQGPVGRGFESHTGSFMWDLESYTKLMWRNPLQTIGADWVVEHENGTWVHKAEPRHATEAITEEAIVRMTEHRNSKEKKPLFLYASYNAAHSPLQPEAEDLAKCGHIKNLWRRQFCGMVVGLDRGITRLVSEAELILGPNTVVVVTPDNGGSVWFGGLNAPLRSGKLTPFEGGVRVPAIVLDLSGKRVKGGRKLEHLVHISDWLPTFLDWANAPNSPQLGLDGVSQTSTLIGGKAARTEVLLELFSSEQSHDGSESAAYRAGKFKLIAGHMRDSHWYKEPTDDKVSTSDSSILPRVLELIVRGFEWIFGNGPCDPVHIILMNSVLFNQYKSRTEPRVMLFDIENDPEESEDIADQHPHIVKDLVARIEKVRAKMPSSPRYWMVSPNWTQAFLPGDCHGQDVLAEKHCRFAHHWLPESANLSDEEALGLENGFRVRLREDGLLASFVVLLILLLIASLAIAKCSKSSEGIRTKTD